MITSTIHFYFCYFAAVYSLFASIAIHLILPSKSKQLIKGRLHLLQCCVNLKSCLQIKIQSPKEKQSPLILLCTRPHFCLPAIKLTMLTLLLIGLVVFLFYQTWSHHISHNKAVYNIILVLKISKYKSIII